jgi:23S rRNA pseudouridine2605 synthase
MKEKTVIRLDKFLTTSGLASRRGSRKFLKENELLVNGMIVTDPTVKIDTENDVLQLNGKNLDEKRFVYFALHKPLNVISTTSDELGREDVTSLIETGRTIFPVGRLDKDTTGIILLTDDGELTHQLTHPRYHVPKVYRLTIDGTVTKEQLNTLQHGVELNDGKTLPAIAKVIAEEKGKTVLELTIREGRNRQVRRMCGVVGIKLEALERIAFGPVLLGDLKEKEYRELTDEEVAALKHATRTHIV